MTISKELLAEKLGRMDLFSSIAPPILLELAGKTDIAVYQADGNIFQKDEPGRSLYLILSGTVKVHDADYTVAHMTEGSCFGELALLDEGPRSMSITATEPTVLAHIDRKAFFEVFQNYPEVTQKIVGMLTHRLRFQTDRVVEHLRQREEELTRLVEERTAELTRQKEEAEYQRHRAEQSERLEQQFLANMSHEIRTPMNAVLGMTNLLLQKSPRPDQMKYLESIRMSSEALLVILNDILDVSKIQAGRMELETAPLELSKILHQVESTVQYRATEKDLALMLDYDPAIPPVLLGDSIRLQQILINLAGNAVKFTEKGSVTLQAKLLETNEQHCRLYFEVRDTGIGMSPEQLKVAFESFRQASSDTTRRYGGTGLGLSISKQLVDLFGGRLDASSAVGEGSAFFFEISLEIGTMPAAVEINATNAPQTLRGLRILLAEDNHFNRIVAVETLELMIPELYIKVAENGQEALRFVQEEAFDVVLMDVSMPVMDGLEATRQIRKLNAAVANIPIIAFTASVSSKEVALCLETGMNTCVPKPFKKAELLDALLRFAGRETVLAAPLAVEKAQTPENQEINLGFLEKLTGGNRDRMNKYLRLYLESAATSLPNIEAAMRANDPESLRRVVHAIKPQLRMTGLEPLGDLAQEIENHVLEGLAPRAIDEKIGRLLEGIRHSVGIFEKMLAEKS